MIIRPTNADDWAALKSVRLAALPGAVVLGAALGGCAELAPTGAPGVHLIERQVVADARAWEATAARTPVPAVPAVLQAGAPGDNLKLWLYDPRGAEARPLATTLFLQQVAPGAPWQPGMTSFADGSISLHLPPGDYQFDVAEPPGTEDRLRRRRYQVAVSAQGVARIAGQAPDARGWHALTLDLAPTAAHTAAPADARARARRERLNALAGEPASTFRPQSACQLPDAVAPARSFASDTSSGFPKVRVRLPSSGRIRALIVPVDFADLAGRDDPGAFFTPLARSVRDFYRAASYGRVEFDFDILAHWVRLPFGPERFGIGAANGSGNFQGYREAIIALTDGQIDYAGYDAVYFLVPKEMPMARMGYGPAITWPAWTGTGYVVNGATGGADMYVNESRGVEGAQWKWMAHETGHAFGLVDEDLRHETRTLGSWGIMADSWSNHAIEHNGWDRYLQGWLPETQVACLSGPGRAGAGVGVGVSTEARVKLSPIERRDAALKVAMVPLGATKILVLESRRNEGYDRIPAGREGVLAYTVDTALGQLAGGYRTQRRPGSTGREFEDAALHPGDAIEVDGVRVTVLAAGADGDTVALKTAAETLQAASPGASR